MGSEKDCRDVLYNPDGSPKIPPPLEQDPEALEQIVGEHLSPDLQTLHIKSRIPNLDTRTKIIAGTAALIAAATLTAGYFIYKASREKRVKNN